MPIHSRPAPEAAEVRRDWVTNTPPGDTGAAGEDASTTTSLNEAEGRECGEQDAGEKSARERIQADEVAHDAYEQEHLEDFIREQIQQGASVRGVYPPNSETLSEFYRVSGRRLER